MSAQKDFSAMVAAWRLRRRWPHLFAMLVGGLLLYTGGADYGVRFVRQHHLFGYHGKAAFSLQTEIACYAVGAAIFAWGMARGFTSRFPKWLVISVVLGLAMAALALLGSLLSSGGGNSAGGGDGSSGSKPARTRLDARDTRTLWNGRDPYLAAAVVDPDLVDALLGGTAVGPRMVGPRSHRDRSIATWRGPVMADGRHAPHLTVTVRAWTRGGARTSSARLSAAVPIAGVGDSAFILRRAVAGSDLVSVRAALRDWLVTVTVRVPNPQRDSAPMAIDLAARALAKLDAAERVNVSLS